jgi:MFS family permease
MATYLAMTGVPYLALRLGAGPLALGILPVARALPYSLSTIWAGGRTEGRERLRWARWTLVVAAVAVGALTLVGKVGLIYPLLVLNGLGMAFFWPALQANLADLARGGGVGTLGWFNAAWSSGKTLGFLLGGLLLAGFGFTGIFGAAAGAFLIVAALVTGVPRRGRTAPSPVIATEAPPPPPSPEGEARLARFRRAAWLGNAAGYGMGTVLNVHYPNWLEASGRGATLFGTYLGLVFAAQTVTFLLLTRFTGWRHRAAPLLLAQAPLVGVMIVLPRLTGAPAILATAPLVGAGLGMAYFSSLFYSVESPRERGRNAGIHEALLGAGSVLLPVMGGWAATVSGSLDAPYVVSAAAGGGVMAAQWVLLRPRKGT